MHRSEMPVVLSYGMGWDSTAILLRWLLDPSSRDFDLSRLIVISAQVGEEFDDTRLLVESHILPLLRTHGVRYVQVARGGPKESDGIVVLDDSRTPIKCLTEGHYRLSQELLSAGTLPTVASSIGRRCSLKFKGWVIDTWLAEAMEGRPFRHIIGFNADETKRVERDKSYSTAIRQSEYPLLEWDWGREKLEQYVRDTLEVDWKKSACWCCPFAGGRTPMLLRYQTHPEAGANAIVLEHLALALNPRMTLYGGSKSVRESIEKDGNEEALALAEQQLDGCEWAIYRVQRAYFGKGCAHRKITAVERGPRSEMIGLLPTYQDQIGGEIEHAMNSPRLYLRRRDGEYPTTEEFYVPAPGWAEDKCRASFDQRWRDLTRDVKQLSFLAA